ncbi:hypothetical protein C7H09_08160 [Marinobacter fuscus]|uniref:Uncharacterized protein n=2 Tax=Marinobacter fuscus TaxID=2109942 RepID=A0A2T1KFU1_9GAMM|nr:hypothetical protein C7H09_08160 [Marinobacter fuscus]
MDILHFDDTSYEDEPCQVRIGEKDIVVDYEEDGKRILYRGHERGAGHYELTSEQVKGRATLHRFEGSNILEGSWIEDGVRGMWKIRLA